MLSPDSYRNQLKKVEWSSFETAYDSSSEIPRHLEDLISGHHPTALGASHKLWCSLCHQKAYVSSAALPALPFFKAALEKSNDELAVEILDILHGFCVAPPTSEDAKAMHPELVSGLREMAPLVDQFLTSENDDVRNFAEMFREDLP